MVSILVEGLVDLRIPRCKYSFTASSFSPLIDQEMKGGGDLEPYTSAGTRFGCLHPITALQLYTSIALPRMLYGAEIWCLTNTELEMRGPIGKSLERFKDSSQ